MGELKLSVEKEINPCRVCVVGASGRIGSLLVKKLLERGHTVHATVRNVRDGEKTGVLKSLPGADSRLFLFDLDLFRPHGQLEPAIQGCHFVFLVAFPTRPPPAESLQDQFYVSSKTAAEQLLTSYGADKDGRENSSPAAAAPEVVVLTCGLIGGGAIVDIVSGVRELVSPITGDAVGFGALSFLQRLLCSVPVVHQDDVCEAHLFCMGVPLGSTHGAGRFLCATAYPTLGDIITHHRLTYPDLQAMPANELPEEDCGRRIRGGSTRLKEMGFEYKYGMEQILEDSVRFAKKVGLLKDG